MTADRHSHGLVLAFGMLVGLSACATPSASPIVSSPSDGEATTPEPSATEVPSPSAGPSTSAAPTTPIWQEVSAAGGPSPREDHTWTVDGDGAVAYLFGGRDGGTTHGDLWAYDLATDAWTQLHVHEPAPAPRFGHEAVWVDGIGLVVFAGQQGAAFFNDLWAYDPASGGWRQLPATGAVPVPRYGTCAAVGPDGRLWISHGFTTDGTRFADTLAYDFVSASWADETPAADRPVSRCLHGCWWTDDNWFMLYAGQTTGVTALGDLWRLTVGERPGTNAWTQLGGSLPPERNLYARARVGAATVVFGGQALDGSYIGGLWRFADGEDGAEAVPTTGQEPPGRAGGELIWDEPRGRTLLFGGKGDGGALSDLWALTGVGG